MLLKISTTSMTPIYEQIADQIRQQIAQGILTPNMLLPSVRSCAKDYHISALTVKKAYDLLESEGYVQTVHGKGTYVSQISASLAQEEVLRQIEKAFEQAISKAKRLNMSKDDILELVTLLLEDNHDSN